MCNAVRDGGRRCPIHQHTSIAGIRAVVAATGLQRRQVENTFRELRREGADITEISPAARQQAIDNLRVVAEEANDLTAYERQMRIADRWNEEPDQATSYALTHLVEISKRKAEALKAELQSVADRTGYTLEEVQAKYYEEYDAVPTGNNVEMPVEHTAAATQRQRRAGLPYDRSSVVALERVRTLVSPDNRQARIENHEPINSTNLAFVGYHEGRLEVSFQHEPETFYAYQNVPEALYERLRSAQRPGSVYSRSIRGNSEYTYDSPEAAEADGYVLRCASCGQFRAQRHNCPERAARNNLAAFGTPAENIQEALDAGVSPEVPEAAFVVEDLTRVDYASSASEEEVAEYVASADFQERLPFGTASTSQAPDGTTRHVVNLGEEFTEHETFRAHTGSMQNRRPSTFTRAFFDRDNPTAEELEVMIETRDAFNALSTVTTLHYINVVRDNLHRADFSMPVSAEFNRMTSPDTANRMLPSSTVSGTIQIGRLAEGETLEDAIIRERHLKCTCADYQENYDCVHVRATARNPYVFLTNRSRRFVEGEHYTSYINRHSVAVQDEERIRNRMRTAGVDRARAIELAEEERAEQQRQREEQERYYRASQAERERINMERGLREAETLRTRNATVVATSDEYRTRMMARWEEEEPGYTGNVDALYEDYRETLRRKRAGEEYMDFRTENVTDGICADEPGARAFGIELEFDIGSGHNRSTSLRKIAEELYEAGLTEENYQQEYHSARASGWGAWSFEEDCTVHGELVSPIMKDTPEHWNQLKTALEIITRNGGVATTRTGSHVHISTASYESSPAKHLELLRQVNQNDEMMYRLATDPARGSHRGMRWCAPNVNDTSETVSADVSSSHNVLGSHMSHSYAMNFEGTYSSDYSRSNIEFRMWDATLDAAVIQRQIMVSAAMTDQAERNVINNGESARPTASRSRIGAARTAERTLLGTSRTHTRETFEQSMGSAPQFFDGLFRRQEDRQRVASLFAVTNWQNYNDSYDDDDDDDDGYY